MNRGVQALRDEVEANGTEVDKECLRYVLDQEAGISEEAYAQQEVDDERSITRH